MQLPLLERKARGVSMMCKVEEPSPHPWMLHWVPKLLCTKKAKLFQMEMLFSQFMWSSIWNLVKLKNKEYQHYREKKKKATANKWIQAHLISKQKNFHKNTQLREALYIRSLFFVNIDSSWIERTGLKGIFVTFSTIWLYLLKCHNPSAVLAFNCKWMVFIQLVHFFLTFILPQRTTLPLEILFQIELIELLKAW